MMTSFNQDIIIVFFHKNLNLLVGTGETEITRQCVNTEFLLRISILPFCLYDTYRYICLHHLSVFMLAFHHLQTKEAVRLSNCKMLSTWFLLLLQNRAVISQNNNSQSLFSVSNTLSCHPTVSTDWSFPLYSNYYSVHLRLIIKC